MPKNCAQEETADKDHKEIAKLLSTSRKSRITSNTNLLAEAENSGPLSINKEIIPSLKGARSAIQWIRNSLPPPSKYIVDIEIFDATIQIQGKSNRRFPD